MKSSELRIGNLVEFKGRKDCYCEVTELYYSGGIHINRYFTDGESDDQPEIIEDITPIPLTPEWLQRSGFEQLPWGWVHGTLKDKAVLIRGLLTKDKFWVELGNGLRIDLPYVHTLQNFFALTGNELTIE